MCPLVFFIFTIHSPHHAPVPTSLRSALHREILWVIAGWYILKLLALKLDMVLLRGFPYRITLYPVRALTINPDRISRQVCIMAVDVFSDKWNLSSVSDADREILTRG